MTSNLERDLGAWAREELSRERLLARHGSAASTLVGIHERLTAAAAATPLPDVETGWAVLLGAIDQPSPVVPFRRHAGRRTIAIAVAAAIAIAGIAYATTVRGRHHDAPASHPPTALAFAGPAADIAAAGDRRIVRVPPHPVIPGGGHRRAEGGGTPSSGTGNDTTDPAGDRTQPKPGDDPNDRDQGTGDDGSHHDHGTGNNGPEGSPPPTSRAQHR